MIAELLILGILRSDFTAYASFSPTFRPLFNIKFVIRGPVGGPGSRSLLLFLPRFPAPILVRFFVASECPMLRIHARLAFSCMRWGIQPPGSVAFA